MHCHYIATKIKLARMRIKPFLQIFGCSIIVLNRMDTNNRKIKRYEVTLQNLDKKYIVILKQNLRCLTCLCFLIN